MAALWGPVGSCFKFSAIIADFTLMGENGKKGREMLVQGSKLGAHRKMTKSSENERYPAWDLKACPLKGIWTVCQS